MKITLDLPADLLRAMKTRATREARTFKDVAAEIFRHGVAQMEPSQCRAIRRPVKLSLIAAPRVTKLKLTGGKVQRHRASRTHRARQPFLELAGSVEGRRGSSRKRGFER